ncbi:hypothetical protein AHAS_Ahas13G0238900 [Arachis hypogaea]
MEMRAVEGASEQVREQNAKEEEEQATFDLENGQMKFEEKVMSDHNNNGDTEFQASKFQRLNPTNPLRIVINNATRVASLSPDHHHQSQQPPPSQPPSTPSIPQQTVTLNSRRYTNKITLFLFLLHMGMQSSTKFGFLRALTRNLGSACLGSLFVPAIEATSRFLNLVEGEDEFLFARCCFRVTESIFRYGNGWAYVQIAAYVSAWTSQFYQNFTAILSLLTFFIGYLLTRIAMALPQACVSCYYVCYAENPDNRLFDTTIKDFLDMVKSGRHVAVSLSRHYHGGLQVIKCQI